MKLKPYGWRVYVAPIDLEEDLAMSEYLKNVGFKIKAGMDANDDRRAKVALSSGTLACIGPTAFHKEDWGWDEQKRCPTEFYDPPKVGDKVWFGKYAGKLVLDPEDNIEYMLLNDEDLQSQIEE